MTMTHGEAERRAVALRYPKTPTMAATPTPDAAPSGADGSDAGLPAMSSRPRRAPSGPGKYLAWSEGPPI